MAKAKVSIRRMDTVTSDKATYELVEGGFTQKNGTERRTLGILKNGSPLFAGMRPVNFTAETVVAICSALADGGLELAAEWAKNDIASRK